MYKEIIAILDIGSSKIIAAAGKKDYKGTVSISAIEKEATNSSVRRGRVYNVDEVGNKIKLLINRLNNKLDEKISKIYVGVGGQSLKTETYFVTEEPGGAIVNEQLLASLRKQCEAYQPEFTEVLDIVSPEYFLDGKPEKKPIGVFCNKIEARYQLVLGSPSIKLHLKNCITEKNGIEIAGYIISPIATAAAVLSDSEKNLGCALIEFGAGITYLSIYKDGLLKYLASIPLGGNVITKDISGLQILEDEAENLKITYGSAIIETSNESNSIKNIKLQDSQIKEIGIEQLNDVVEARTDEIIANIKNLLETSGFFDVMGSGIIITGGMAALKNLAESIEEKTNKKVRVAHVKEDILNKDSSIFEETFGNEVTIGLLLSGTENCVKVKDVEKVVNQTQTSLFSEEEVITVKPPVGGGGKLPDKNQKTKNDGFFSRMTKKVEKKVDEVSRGLFSDDSDSENGEN